jgi:hypothetical protein
LIKNAMYLQTKYQDRNPLNNEVQECKTGHVKRRVIVGEEGK